MHLRYGNKFVFERIALLQIRVMKIRFIERKLSFAPQTYFSIASVTWRRVIEWHVTAELKCVCGRKLSLHILRYFHDICFVKLRKAWDRVAGLMDCAANNCAGLYLCWKPQSDRWVKHTVKSTQVSCAWFFRCHFAQLYQSNYTFYLVLSCLFKLIADSTIFWATCFD